MAATFSRVRLRALRTQAELSIDALAHQAGLSCSTVWRYERGQTVPDYNNICRLAEVLGCGVADFQDRAS